ncbi:MAG: M10 family metallopeptidase [Hyphomicrobium sp.]
MATPTSNSVLTTDVDPLMAGLGRYTVSGYKWGGGLGQGVTLTYSFPGLSAAHASPYGYYTSNDEWQGFTPLTSAEQAAARAGLAVWSTVADITFVQVADTAATVGEIRFGKSSTLGADEAAHAYYPANDPSSGDVWFNSANWNTMPGDNLAPGTFDFATIIHELGHALGLKHSFEAPNAIPTSLDNSFYSVMSYSARVSGDSGWSSFQPTTAMYYDLLGIQALYGRNMSHNAGNTTYAFVEGQTYFQTIDDASGIDTITYQGTLASTIDLNQGRFSSLSAPITFDNGSTRATVAIGPNSIIENATGGSGGDTLTGNGVANTLNGAAGHDKLYGYSGNDMLLGGLGNDVISGGDGIDRLWGSAGNDMLAGGIGRDFFIFNCGLSATVNLDRMTDFSVIDDTIALENAIFTRVSAPGALSAAMFATGIAHDTSDRVIYDKARGWLSYDADGTGTAHAAIKFATVTANLSLSAADFVVV